MKLLSCRKYRNVYNGDVSQRIDLRRYIKFVLLKHKWSTIFLNFILEEGGHFLYG